MEDWKKELDRYIKEQKNTKKDSKQKKEVVKKAVKRFIKGEVIPAFDALRREFKKHKIELEVDSKKDWAAVLVKRKKHKEFVYEVNISMTDGELAASKSVYTANKKGKLKLGGEGKIGNSQNSYLLNSIKKEDIIQDFIDDYKRSTRGK